MANAGGFAMDMRLGWIGIIRNWSAHNKNIAEMWLFGS